MKLNTIDEMIAVLQAYKKGKTIIKIETCKDYNIKEDMDCGFDFTKYYYEIKEGPTQPRMYRVEPYTPDEIIAYTNALKDGKTLVNANTGLKCGSLNHFMGWIANNTSIKIQEEPKKTYWSKPEDVPVGAVIQDLKIDKLSQSKIITSASETHVLCSGYTIHFSHMHDKKWRFPHERKESDWKECTVESLEKYK